VRADLEAALHDSAKVVRIQAAKALGRPQLPQTAPALVGVLALHDEALASQVRLALHQLGRGAMPAFLKGAHSPDPWVRWHVFRIVAALHAVRGKSALFEGLADSDYAVAWMAARVGVT
jgi:HEAT repeat protein